MSKYDYVIWGGLKSETTHLEKIIFSDGVHIKEWKGSSIIYRISNSALLSSSDSVIVGLNAPISSRATKNPPFFTGGGKATNIDAPLLSISDSSTHSGNVALGWYLGTEKDPNFQQNLAEFIEGFCSQRNVTPIIFGGSGGGFASIVLGDLLNIKSVVLAMNPQMDVLKWYPSHLKNLYTKQWDCSHADQFLEKLNQNNIIFNLNQLNFNPKSDVLIMQNLFDDYQMVDHFPILSELDFKNLNPVGSKQNIGWFFGTWGPGHYAPWPEHVKTSLKIATSELSTTPVIDYLNQQFFPTEVEPLIVKKRDISLSGGGKLGEFGSLFHYRARSDLNYEKIPVYNFEYSQYDQADRNLAFCLHSLRQVDFLLRDERISKFSTHLVLHHLLSWWDFTSSIKREDSVMAWYDMSSGLRAQKLAYVIGLIEYIPAVKKYCEVLLEMANEHINWFEKPGFVKSGNHGIFQIHGYMALAKAMNLHHLEPKIRLMMNSIFDGQFSKNLMHVENSPEYHQFVISIFDSYFRTGWYGNDIAQKLADAKVLNYWLVDTENKYFCVGDTEPKKIELLSSNINKAIQGADITFQTKHSEYHVKQFDVTGYLCLKSKDYSGDAFFSLSAFSNIGHRQADDLSFVLFDSGKWRFEDPGKYTYQRDKRKYIDKSHQHNCLTIDDLSYSVKSDARYTSCRTESRYHGESGIFQTTMKRSPHAGVEQTRYCLYAPKEFFVLIDKIESNQEHKYSQWFQIGSGYRKFTQNDSFVTFDTDLEDTFWIQFLSTDSSSMVKSYIGDHEKPVGWVSKKYQHLEPNVAFEHRTKTSSATFCAISGFSREISMEKIIHRINQLDIGLDADLFNDQV